MELKATRRGSHRPNAVAIPQIPTFNAVMQFTRAEGLLPAPKSAHAIRVTIDEALDAKQKGETHVTVQPVRFYAGTCLPQVGETRIPQMMDVDKKPLMYAIITGFYHSIYHTGDSCARTTSRTD